MVSITQNAVAVRLEYRLSYQWAIDAHQALTDRITRAQQAVVRSARAKQQAAQARAVSLRRSVAQFGSSARDRIAGALIGIPATRVQELRTLVLTPPAPAVASSAKPRTKRSSAAVAGTLSACDNGVIVDAKEFREALSTVAKIVPGRSALPILEHVLLIPGTDSVTLRTFDLEIGAEATCRASIGACEPMAVPAKSLLKQLQKRSGEVEIIPNPQESNVTMRIGGAEIHLPTLPAEEFPGVYEGIGDWQRCDGLPLALNRMLAATSPDESRAILTGVMIGRTHCIASDGHRLHMTTHGQDFGTAWPESSDEYNVILPQRAASYAVNALGCKDGQSPVEFRLGEDRACIEFRCGGSRFVSRLIEGKYPNYQRIIPQGSPTTWTVEADAFLEAVDACWPVAAENANRIILQGVGDTLHVSAEAGECGKVAASCAVTQAGPNIGKRNPDEGKWIVNSELLSDPSYKRPASSAMTKKNAKEFMANVSKSDPQYRYWMEQIPVTEPENRIAFNARYLHDAVRLSGAAFVTFSLSAPLSAATVKDSAGEDPALAVIMPMQIM